MGELLTYEAPLANRHRCQGFDSFALVWYPANRRPAGQPCKILNRRMSSAHTCLARNNQRTESAQTPDAAWIFRVRRAA